MGDRSQANLTLYGVAGVEVQLSELLSDWQTDWGTFSPPDVSHFVEGCEVVDDERSVGAAWDEGDLWTAIEGLGVSYWFEQDAKYEWPAVERMFTPELGSFIEDSLGEAGVAIPGYQIDGVVDEAQRIYESYGGENGAHGSDCVSDLMDLFTGLSKKTGRAHRESLGALAKPVAEAQLAQLKADREARDATEASESS
jgi:hypothetical protein